MDPEERRLLELAGRVRDGAASDADREELALYGEAGADVEALVQRMDAERELGGTWLERTARDRELLAAEKTPWTQAERRMGVALVVGGGIGALVFPPAAIGLLAGGALLAWSVVRVKIKTAGRDPYEDIEQ